MSAPSITVPPRDRLRARVRLERNPSVAKPVVDGVGKPTGGGGGGGGKQPARRSDAGHWPVSTTTRTAPTRAFWYEGGGLLVITPTSSRWGATLNAVPGGAGQARRTDGVSAGTCRSGTRSPHSSPGSGDCSRGAHARVVAANHREGLGSEARVCVERGQPGHELGDALFVDRMRKALVAQLDTVRPVDRRGRCSRLRSDPARWRPRDRGHQRGTHRPRPHASGSPSARSSVPSLRPRPTAAGPSPDRCRAHRRSSR